jgi:acyl carrier protein
MNVKDEIRIFLSTEPIFKGLLPETISDDFSLINSGALDSIGIFSLISFLEKRFSVSVEPQDLNETHFKSIQAIEAFVASRKK